MKTLVLLIGLLPAFALAQIPFEPAVIDNPGVSVLSPLSHLKPVPTLNKAAAPPPFRCANFFYYQNDPLQATYHYYTENLPVSSKWAMKITTPQTVTVCTVWSVKVDFELLGANTIDKDTIRFFIKEATPPYTEIFNTYFIARIGLNRGYYEIDPPIVPPFNVRSILDPSRDVFIGYYVIGDSSHSVKWRFTTPMLPQFVNPPRSYRFLGPTSPQPASMAVGTSVDWVAESRLCCDYPVPVELSAFNAAVDGQTVRLYWRTETETNNFSFEVLRSRHLEGPWESRTFITGHGTTTEPQDYRFSDSFSFDSFDHGEVPLYWYRLRQRDFDGSVQDSPPMQVLLSDLSDTGFELMPAYPNPVSMTANPFTRLRYRLPTESSVHLTVHDMLGRKVATLVNSYQNAGVYETAWYPMTDGVDLQSGNYFVRIQAGAFSATQKIALIR